MPFDAAQNVETALADFGRAVLDRLREATPAKHWSEPPRVTVETRTKIRASGAVTSITATFDTPFVSVRIERGYGEVGERIVSKVRT